MHACPAESSIGILGILTSVATLDAELSLGFLAVAV
jgi:hypothetical protein